MSLRSQQQRRNLQRLFRAGCAVDQTSLQTGLHLDWIATAARGNMLRVAGLGTAIVLHMRLTAALPLVPITGFRIADELETITLRPCAAHSLPIRIRPADVFTAHPHSPLYVMGKYPRHGWLVASTPALISPDCRLTLFIDSYDDSRPYGFRALPM